MPSKRQEPSQPVELIADDVQAWRQWLAANEDTSDGVWLVMAKKGTVSPTSLTYADALEEALCSGWIDGQRRGRDAGTFHQRFTPRRARSIWSLQNVGRIAALEAQQRMRPRGRAEVEKAKADGRWDRAYAGAATVDMPEDLTAALDASPGALAAFTTLGSGERYAIVLSIITAPNPTTRANRIRRQVQVLTDRTTDGTESLEE